MRHPRTPYPALPWPPCRETLLLLCLARRLIPRGLADLAPGGADQPLSDPGRDADPCQARGLADQLLLLGEHAETEGHRLGALCLGSSHAVIVGQENQCVKDLRFLVSPLDK